MRAWLLLVLVAGCVTPTAPPPGDVNGVPLGALETVSLAPAAWTPHPCAPDAQNSRSAPLLPPFDGSAADALRAIANGMGVLLPAVNVTEHHFQGTFIAYRIKGDNLTGTVEVADAEPSRIILMFDHLAWPGWDNATANLAGEILLDVIDPGGHVTWYVDGSSTRYVSANAGAGADGRVAGSLFDFRGYPQSTIEVDPLQDLSITPLITYDEAVAEADAFLSCFDTEAEVAREQRGYQPHVARFATAAWSILAHVPDAEHHCGGDAWHVLVDTQSGDVVGVEDRLCY